MSARRKTDSPMGRSWFRTERVVQNGGLWFFLTREGTTEGPFSCRTDALNQLEVYIRLAENEMLPHFSFEARNLA
jgi:hypothetical protein